MERDYRKGGLRVVSIVEAAKGLLVLLAGFGLLAYIHKDLHIAAEHLVQHFHLNPASRYPHIFLDLIDRVTDAQVWVLALSALLYAVVRFVEAYGLWLQRRWAEWFGLIAGGIYVPLNSIMLRQAAVAGVSGIIASSISSRDLESFLHVNLIELIDCIDIESAQARLPQLTILLTEGPGTVAMPTRTIQLLSHYQGSMALLSGATSIRQGVFPELVISLPTAELQQDWQPLQPDTALAIGAQVRVCSGDHEGAIGTIDYLYAHQQVFSSGILARSARLRLEDGSLLTVPLTVIERIS